MHRQLHPAQQRAAASICPHDVGDARICCCCCCRRNASRGRLSPHNSFQGRYVINLVSNATKMLVANSLAPLCACLARISAKIGSLPQHSCTNTAASDRDGASSRHRRPHRPRLERASWGRQCRNQRPPGQSVGARRVWLGGCIPQRTGALWASCESAVDGGMQQGSFRASASHSPLSCVRPACVPWASLPRTQGK